MMKRLFHEPLLQFTLAAVAIFIAYGLLAPSSERRTEDIVVSVPKIDQLAAVFAKTWQRPPSPEELKGLIDAHVKEEIDVREALALGLDQGDTVIRRRLQQKIQFIADAGADAVAPTDAELQTYLDAHPEKFETAAKAAFEQLFLNPARWGEAIDAEATVILAKLEADPALEAAALGDASLLPAQMPPTDIASIGNIFGPEFATAISAAPAGRWIGPVPSSFGLHLVRVSQHSPGRLPALGDVGGVVLREFANERREAFEAERLEALLKRYRVVIEAPEAGATP